MKICLKYTHPEDIQDVDHLLTMDPLQWMGAVRMRVQTDDKNITIILKESTPLQSIS